MFYAPRERYTITAKVHHPKGFSLFFVGKGAIEDGLVVSALTMKNISPSIKAMKSIIIVSFVVVFVIC